MKKETCGVGKIGPTGIRCRRGSRTTRWGSVVETHQIVLYTLTPTPLHVPLEELRRGHSWLLFSRSTSYGSLSNHCLRIDM